MTNNVLYIILNYIILPGDKIVAKYFKVPHCAANDKNKNDLKKIIISIGREIKGRNSAFKRGIKMLAELTEASKREVKQITKSFPSLRAQELWRNCVYIQKISIEHYIAILRELISKVKNNARFASGTQINLADNLAKQLSKAERYGLEQVEGNIEECNRVNRMNNSGEVAAKLLGGIRESWGI